MKKITICILLVLLVFGIGQVFAGVETVKDNNDGHYGDILINTGTKNGQSDVGTWTNPSFLKGAKGDKGDQGLQGVGIAGANGIDGYTPIKGVDYFDGLNGNDGVSIKGAKGDKGDQGVAGENGKDVDLLTVTNLQNADKTLQENINIEQFDRIKLGNDLQDNINTETTNRINTNNKLQDNINSTNSRIDDTNNRVSKLEGTQYNLRNEVKFIRNKNTEVGVYTIFNSNRKVVSEVGINIVVGFGESYQDKENKKINMRLNNIEKKLGATTVFEKTIENGKIRSIRISSGLATIEGGF